MRSPVFRSSSGPSRPEESGPWPQKDPSEIMMVRRGMSKMMMMIETSTLIESCARAARGSTYLVECRGLLIRGASGVANKGIARSTRQRWRVLF